MNIREALKQLLRAVDVLNPIARSTMLEECGQCGCYHRSGYTGDCRNNDERFPTSDPFEDILEAAREALAHGPELVSIKIVHTLDTDTVLSDLGTYSNTPGPDDRTIDREERGDRQRNQYRYFIAAASGKETGDPDSVEQAYQRMEALNRGEWYMISIKAKAEVRYPTGNGSYRHEHFTSGGLWGVPSDDNESDIKETEQEQLADLRDHLSVFGVDVSKFDELAAKAVIVQT